MVNAEIKGKMMVSTLDVFKNLNRKLRMKIYRSSKLVLFLTIFFLVTTQSIHSFEIPTEIRKKLSMGNEAKNYQASEEQDLGDYSLDPNRYIIGGGDKFQISIVGLPSQEYFPLVDADGNMYDGELGLISVGKISLAQAREKITLEIKKILRKNYNVYIVLNHIKNATVTITGLANNPGSVSFRGNTHLLDAIRQANNGILPSFSQFDLRHVQVRNLDSTKEFDLIKFLNKQDLDQNPYIYPGDFITLKNLDDKIYVTGECDGYAKGWLPIKKDETAETIFNLLNLRQNADSNKIFISHASGSDKTTISPLSLDDAVKIKLQPNDIITIGTKIQANRSDTVIVTGELNRPGTYPITRDLQDAQSIITLAGGITPYGSTDRILILRHRKLEELYLNNEKDSQVKGFGTLTKGVSQGYQSSRPEISSSYSDLVNFGDFTLIDITEKNRTIVLKDGDEIHVPRNDNSVYVSGHIRKPGFYPFTAGATLEHYVDLAGGYTNKADTKNKYVIQSYRGVTQIKDSDEIRSGEIIVIPAAIEYKRFINVYLPILNLIPGILSIFLTLYVLNSR